MPALYTAVATAIGGRQGHIRSDDGVLDTPLAHPKEPGGPGGPGDKATNPEQLFAAGYAACFENALLRVARERRPRPRSPLRHCEERSDAAIQSGTNSPLDSCANQ